MEPWSRHLTYVILTGCVLLPGIDFQGSIEMANVSIEHIEKTPGVCGGRACIAGHRIRVMDIAVLHEKRGLAAEEIAREYPGISLADVHAALTYFLDHRAEIEDEFRQDEQVVSKLLARHPSKVQARLNG